MPRIYKDEFESGAEFMAALVSDHGAPHRDPRLERSAAATGLGEAFAAEGGFLVPSSFAADLWNTVYDIGSVLRLCQPQPVTVGNGISVPAIDESSRADGSRFGGVEMFWLDEGVTPTATRPKYRSLNLKPKKLLAISYATGELLEDAPALAAWLERTFGLEASFEIEDAIINGNGAGRPLGILNSNALITVAKESGQAAATVVAANLVGMAGRLWGPSHRTAVWLMSNAVFLQICDDSFSNGSPVITYGPNGQRFILGMPLMLVEYTPVVGTAGDVILADFSQYLVSSIAPEFISSIHVRFLNDEGVFRSRFRIDGQPAWSGPLTPRNGSATESPFVTLAERA